MPYTTTHVLVSIILIELFREYFFKNNKKFPRYYILIAAIGGIIPDIEYLFRLDYMGRTFMHSLFVPLIFLLIGFFILKLNVRHKGLRKRHMNLPTIFFIFSGMSLVHLLLDMIFIGQVTPFYGVSDFSIGLELISRFKQPYLQELFLPFIDAVLLFFWIFWMEFKLKIDDYF